LLKYSVVGLVLTTGPLQAKELCITPAEMRADQTRFIEVQLKVASLQCKSGSNAEISMLYNNFLKENMPYLVQSQPPLKAWLKRAKKDSVDKYMARTANKISLATSNISQFCERSRMAAEYAGKTYNPLMLLTLLPIPYEKPANICQPNTYAQIHKY